MNHTMRVDRQKWGPQTARHSTQRPGNIAVSPAVRTALTFVHRETEASDPNARDAELANIEACLMLADEPLSPKRLAEVVGLADVGMARKQVARLQAMLAADGSAFQIAEVAGGYQLRTLEAYHPWLVRLRRTGHEARLTSAGMETLAIVAYKQPLTRAEIDKIRGVASADLLRVLMEKGLVRVTGRHDSLGRPQLYGTTPQFLVVFGLNSLADLPESEAFRKSQK